MVEPSFYEEEINMAPGNNPDFPDAPRGWGKEEATQIAMAEELAVDDELWQVVRTLQHYFAHHERYNAREVHDALEEAFHHRGGMKYLYTLFPGGPISQGCRVAGIQPPAGATDLSFGSVS